MFANLSLHTVDFNKKLISAHWKGKGKSLNDYIKMNLSLASNVEMALVFFPQ